MDMMLVVDSAEQDPTNSVNWSLSGQSNWMSNMLPLVDNRVGYLQKLIIWII